MHNERTTGCIENLYPDSLTNLQKTMGVLLQMSVLVLVGVISVMMWVWILILLKLIVKMMAAKEAPKFSKSEMFEGGYVTNTQHSDAINDICISPSGT